MEVKRVIDLYKHIDTEIEHLHKLSTNDFSLLNSTFKTNYKKSKEFFDLQKELIQSIQKFIPVSLSGNQVIEREFNHVRQIIQKRLINISSGLDKTNKVLESVFVPLKNYKQNILTINFIISQLTIIKSYTKESNKGDSATISSLFKDLNSLFGTFLERIEKLKQKVEENITQHQTYNTEINKQISDYSSALKNIVEFLKNKQQKTDEYGYKINYDEIIREKSNEIIVNLQYHDIIRQKMDHVQETYKEFLLNFISASEENKDQDEEIMLPYMANLADLQSAQLTHVNKQYQEAIKSINKSIINISEVVGQHTKEVEQIIYSTDKLTFPEKILDELKENQPEDAALNNYVDSSIKLVNELSEEISESADLFKKIKHKNNELIKWIKEIVFVDGSKGILNENLYLQLINVSNETTRFAKEISNSLIKKQQIISNLTNNQHNVSQDLNLYNDNLMDYLKLYEEIIDKIKDKTTLTHRISKEINSEKENVSSSLEYYNYFENAIQKLVDELVIINDEAVSKGLTVTPESFKKQLEDIKHLYTMKSERLIHNNISNMESDQIISTIEEDDDNIEFF